MRFIFCLISLCLITACSPPSDADESSIQSTLPQLPAYTFEVFEKDEGDWGYLILKNETVFIRQPHIPSLPGTKGFSNSEKAEKTATFIVQKLEAGIVPPTVSFNELDSLGVLN